MSQVRMAVVGCGSFGQNHLRVISQNAGARLVAAADQDESKAEAAAKEYGCKALVDWRKLPGLADAAVVATPTVTHGEIAIGLLEAGIEVLVEKPMAHRREDAVAMRDTANRHGRILQVGHLERFNPAVLALQSVLSLPLFFEVHRMSLFQPRSLDVDVVLDLMIHDIDLVLSMVRRMPSEVRAAGIRILSAKVDIANVRLAFPGGCVANLTASRVSTEKVRKLRLFQPHQYISIDYSRQDGVAITVGENQKIGFQALSAEKREPLASQLDSFLDCVITRKTAMVGGQEGLAALEVCLDILAKIEEHGAVVSQTLREYQGNGG